MNTRKARRAAFVSNPDVCIDNCTGLPGTILAFVPVTPHQRADDEGDPTPDSPSDTPLPPLAPWTESVGLPARCWVLRRVCDAYTLTEEEDAEFGQDEFLDWDICAASDDGAENRPYETWVESDEVGGISHGDEPFAYGWF